MTLFERYLSIWVALCIIAGVVLGVAMRGTRIRGERRTPAERAERALHPWSAGLATPLFALTAAGVTLSSVDLTALAGSPVFLGIAAGLLIGKPLGIYVAARLVARLARSAPPEGGTWADVGRIGVALRPCGVELLALAEDFAANGLRHRIHRCAVPEPHHDLRVVRVGF